MKNLIIKGSPKDVKAIVDRLISRHGNIRIEKLLEHYNKEVLVLE